MTCEVAALQFKAHPNYGTWSIDFAIGIQIIELPGLSYKVKAGLL